MLVNQTRQSTYIQHQQNTDGRPKTLERMDFTTKAPDSFLLYCTIRRQELNGQYISSQQLADEWQHMSKEQKTEFQNQSQCIQFTLDIDNRNLHYNDNNKKRLIPKMVVPPPSSMVIPNDHSVESSPISQKEDETDSYFVRKDNHHHHQLSDLLLDTSFHFNNTSSPNANQHPNHHHHRQADNSYIYHQQHNNMYPYHHHHSSQMMGHSSSLPTTSLYSFKYQPPPPITTTTTTTTATNTTTTNSNSNTITSPTGTNNNYKVVSNLPYSAAAEAAALESISFDTTNNQAQQENNMITKAIKNPLPLPSQSRNNSTNVTSQSTKRKYGILPEKVKRPPNAYLLFNRDMRRQLHDINQGLSSGEISKSISQRWKQLSSVSNHAPHFIFY